MIYRIYHTCSCTVYQHICSRYEVTLPTILWSLILLDLWPTNMEILMPIFLIIILTLQFLNESAKQGCFLLFYKPLCLTFCIFSKYFRICMLGLNFSIEIAYPSQSKKHLSQSSETHLGSIKKFVALIQLVGFSLPVGC